MDNVRLLKKQNGFSMVEIMMAVAIISLLLSLAAPTFQRMRTKARQSEAKGNLSALYVAEKAFYAEWLGYTGDFRDIGLALSGRLSYDIGFTSAGWSPGFPFIPAKSFLCDAKMAYNTEVSYCALMPGSSQAKVVFKPATASATCGAALNPTQTAFRATAIGNISTSAGSDVWTIDHAKSLCNNASGI